MALVKTVKRRSKRTYKPSILNSKWKYVQVSLNGTDRL